MEPLEESIIKNTLEFQKDSWEAYKTFRLIRSLFFWLILLCLLFAQASFWLVHLGYAGSPDDIESTGRIISWQVQESAPNAISPPTDEAAKNQTDMRDYVYKVLKICNNVLPFSAVVYCLVMLFGLHLALAGRLGGLAYSTRAFLMSLLVMVLVLAWYQTIYSAAPGTLFEYDELIKKYLAYDEINDWWGYSAYYGRFVGLWGLTFLLLLMAQSLSFKAARKIKQRLLKNQQDSPASIVAAAEEARRSTSTLEELGEKLAELGGDQECH